MKVILLFTFLLLISPAMATSLVVNTSENIQPNAEFETTIDLYINDSITGYQFDLVYDDTMLTVDNLGAGSIMELDAFTSNDGDTVFGTLLNGNHFESDGTINVITFVSTGKTGVTTIGLDNVILIDAELNEYPVEVIDSVICINTPPTMEDLKDVMIREGKPYVYNVTTNDTDGDELTTFYVSSDVGIEGDLNNKSFRWQQPVIGKHEVTVTIGDRWNMAEDTFTIYVYHECDINMDTRIDIMDIVSVASFTIDINNDDNYNILDVVKVANHFGETYILS
jgi:hypothetical protein